MSILDKKTPTHLSILTHGLLMAKVTCEPPEMKYLHFCYNPLKKQIFGYQQLFLLSQIRYVNQVYFSHSNCNDIISRQVDILRIFMMFKFGASGQCGISKEIAPLNLLQAKVPYFLE